MDITDRASELEQEERERAIQKVLHMRLEDAHYNPQGERTCLDCGEVIHPIRVQVLDAKRCLDCQTLLERQEERYGR
jgi:RNA polymerase-binding transcription factor DksA